MLFVCKQVKASISPSTQPNGQSRHGDVTATSGLTRTPSLHNYSLTSSDDQPTTGDTVAPTPLPVTGSVDKPTWTAPGRVGFVTSLVRDDAAVQSTPFNRSTSPSSRDTTDTDALFCRDDYDNTASDDDDKKQTEISRRPSAHHTDLPSHPASAPSTSETKPRTTIKSSEEESLDHLVAHLLGEVAPVSPASSAQSTSSPGQPTSSDAGTSSSLRWPQGDSLPRVVMRRTVDVSDHQVPLSDVYFSGKLVSQELSADENDNLVTNITLHGDVFDLSTSPVSAPVDTVMPPLLTFRKKATPATNIVISSHSRTPELASELNTASGSDNAGKDEQGQDYPISSNHSTEHKLHSDGNMTSHFDVTAEQLSQTERLYTESRRAENESVRDDACVKSDVVSASCDDVQQTSLLEQFKALRLEVLTSTSQLLGCVSGTWKRGESFRSKLTTIMQLCVSLKTSVGRLEDFLQTALAAAAHLVASSPLVDTANTRIKNLQAVQTSIDAYIETLDGENLSGVANKPDLKVGGIIHLTKEIPGLVRTFAPVVEYLAATQPGSDVLPELEAVIDGKEEDRQNPPDMRLDSGALEHKEQQENINNQNDANRNLVQHGASSVVRPGPTEYLHTQNEQATLPDVQEVQVTMVSTNTEPVILRQSVQTDSEQRSHLMTSGSIQVETRPTTTHYDTSAAARDIENKLFASDSDDSQHRSQEPQPPLPVLPIRLEIEAPPTPPPKLRVASHYHACDATLGITNSLTACPSAVDTAAAATTAGRCDDDDDRDHDTATCNIAARLPAETHEIVSGYASDDKFQQTNWQTDDRVGASCEVRTLSEINYVSGRADEIVAAADQGLYRFPRATETTDQPAVVLRRPAAHQADLDVDDRQCRVSESELETPEFRASGVSQTMVDQLEALQRQANTQTVITHTDTTAGYDRFGTSPSPHYQSTLSAEDRRLLMFYCEQMTGHWNVLDDAASAFFHCMARRQPPKVFVSHSKFVIVAGHKMAYLGDVLARNIEDSNAQDWIVVHSNRLCSSLKAAVRATKEAALSYPTVAEQQQMVDSIKYVTDWAIELKEVVDRLAYIGRPDHVLA